MISFTVPGDPFGKQRPRHTKWTGHTYTPKETKNHEEVIAWTYRKNFGNFRFPDKTYIDIGIIAYIGIPKSASKAVREKMIAGEIRPTVKPDWDNIGKLVTDALNGIAYDDDKNIVDAIVRKYYSTIPRTVIFIKEAENLTQLERSKQ